MRAIFKFLSIALILVITQGCSTNLKDSSNFIERDAFVHVEVNNLNISNEDGAQRERQGFGSGVIVESNTYRTLILTAAHVCVPSSDYFSGDVLTFITVSTWNEERLSVEVVGIDIVNDLCMLEGDFSGLPYIRLSRILPKPGDTVYNLAAPYGIFGNKFILTFSGTYSGKMSPDNEQIYTIPAAPGSSGSPVFNSRGHLVGIIHSSTTVMESIAIGPTTEAVLNFVSDF